MKNVNNYVLFKRSPNKNFKKPSQAWTDEKSSCKLNLMQNGSRNYRLVGIEILTLCNSAHKVKEAKHTKLKIVLTFKNQNPLNPTVYI